MRYVDFTPGPAAAFIYRAVLNNGASLHTVDPETRTVTLRKIECGMVPRVDLARIDRVRRMSDELREVMETFGGVWRIAVFEDADKACQEYGCAEVSL
jgi:hypothetical protein